MQIHSLVKVPHVALPNLLAGEALVPEYLQADATPLALAAAVLGMLPMALGRGIGAEMRNAVGVASAGGIAVSGILTLFVLPILSLRLSLRGGLINLLLWIDD